jgi:hypothetical protein
MRYHINNLKTVTGKLKSVGGAILILQYEQADERKPTAEILQQIRQMSGNWKSRSCHFCVLTAESLKQM